MKSILLSIKPEWLVKILNGEKTIEIRKLFPKNYVGWVYLYCSKNYKLNAVKSTWTNSYSCFDKKVAYADSILLNGKVVARFWCDKVEEYTAGRRFVNGCWKSKYGEPENYTKILKPSCLSDSELRKYANDLCFFAIHISKLEIFDRPKELSEFKQCKERKCPYSLPCHKTCHSLKSLTKAPQNYCYIEGEWNE